MNVEDLRELVQEIVKQANDLKNKHTDQKNAPVNYACIFSQSNKEYDDLIVLVKKIGTVVKETPAGPIFRISPINTVSGKLILLKIRLPDKTRPERGDADFTVSDYYEFKKRYISKKGFKLIIKSEDFEMIELIDDKSNVRAYFSHPTLGKLLKINGF